MTVEAKQIKELTKRVIEQDMAIERQRMVIDTQRGTLEFVLSGKPLWKLILL